MPEAVRLLILDDDEGVRLTFAKALALQGYSVRAAGSAREALYQIARERPDAILVDLKMPLVNGVGFLYRLRADPANQGIPVGVITGEVEVDEATADDLIALRRRSGTSPSRSRTFTRSREPFYPRRPPGEASQHWTGISSVAPRTARRLEAHRRSSKRREFLDR